MNGPLVVLDDDPTGVQTLAGVRVLLAWDAERIHTALEGRPAVHLITNSRALAPGAAQRLVGEAGRTALSGAPEARLVLRGDSTLRGHVLEEYLAVREVVSPDRWPALLLVPALPSAGRVTVDGVHFLERDGRRVPVSETDFARDGMFAYSHARLLDWAEERSGGVFAAERGRELHLGALREGGAAAVKDALLELSCGKAPAALAADAETTEDLELLAAGYLAAAGAGANVVVRCAPAFAGALAGTTATTAADVPASGDGVLLVCGSYVAQTTRQLEQLLATHPGVLAEADVAALAGAEPDAERERLAAALSLHLATGGLAILATPRARPVGTTTLDAGERIALGLAEVVARVSPRPSVVVAKGGITSAVVLREGIGAAEADVLGPVIPGVSRWAAAWRDGTPVDYLVVPGNVGADDLLVRLVDLLLGGSASC